MKYPKVSIIVLNYNGLVDTVECLESLKAITYPDYDIVLVDNHSNGDDVKMLRGLYKDIHIVECEINRGFGGGNNRGMQYALRKLNPDYLLLLNNDTIVAPDFVEGLINAFRYFPAVGASVAKICHYDKRDKIEAAGCHIDMWRGQCYRLGWMRKDNGGGKLKEVNSAAINAFMISREAVLDVGFFDEKYFIYMDDADYCTRLINWGYKIIYTPRSKIWHKVGATTRRVTGLPYYYLARNNFRFMRQHATKAQYRFFLTYFFGIHLWMMSAAYLLYFRNLDVVKGYFQGVKDGLSQITGEVVKL